MDGRWQWTLFGALGLSLLAGCGKGQIDYIENGPGCSTCESCAHQFGSCKGAGAACKPGYVDIDADENGCETRVLDVEGDFTAESSPSQSVTWFVINEKGFDMYAWPELVALDGDLDCIASPDNPCSYTLRALKIALTDFSFDYVHWLGGSATLEGPLDVTDEGAGLVLERVPLVFGFDFDQEDEQTSAVSSGNVRIVLQYDAAQDAGSISVESNEPVRFGGYSLDSMSMSARLDAF